MTPQEVKDLIVAQITDNNNNEITGAVMRPVLIAIVDLLDGLIGDTTQLATADKSNVVGAINELHQQVQQIGQQILPDVIPEEKVYGKLFTGDISGFFELDWKLYTVWRLTMTADTQIAEVNLPQGPDLDRVGAMYITGDFNLTLPSYWVQYGGGTYDGTKWNLYVIDSLDETIPESVYTLAQLQDFTPPPLNFDFSPFQITDTIALMFQVDGRTGSWGSIPITGTPTPINYVNQWIDDQNPVLQQALLGGVVQATPDPITGKLDGSDNYPLTTGLATIISGGNVVINPNNGKVALDINGGIYDGGALFTENDDFSVTFIVRPTSANRGVFFSSKSQQTGQGHRLNLMIDYGNDLFCVVHTADGEFTMDYPDGFQIGQTYIITISHDHTTKTINTSVNGLNDTFTYTGQWTSTNFRIGADMGGTTPFEGMIQGCLVGSTFLTNQQMFSLFQQTELILIS